MRRAAENEARGEIQHLAASVSENGYKEMGWRKETK